jgi:hypothetical protein
VGHNLPQEAPGEFAAAVMSLVDFAAVPSSNIDREG